MGFFTSLINKFKKNPQTAEELQYRETLNKIPDDIGLRVKFTKICLRRHFTKETSAETLEAVEWFEKNGFSEIFDPEFFYLMGRFYQRKRDDRAKEMYLTGIREFNRYIGMNPGLKQDFMEVALANALNLMTLQPDHCDPELLKFFNSLHKSYPLHIKRVELESEIEKSNTDSKRVKQLTDEMKRIKAEFASTRRKIRPCE